MKPLYAATLMILTPIPGAWANQGDQAVENWAQHRWERPSIRQEYRDSVLVFEGNVLSARNVIRDGMLSGTFYTIAVDERFKGREPGTVSVYSENTSGRYEMNVGVQYLVFAYRGRFDGAEGLILSVNCAGNSGEWRHTKVNLVELRELEILPNQSTDPVP